METSDDGLNYFQLRPAAVRDFCGLDVDDDIRVEHIIDLGDFIKDQFIDWMARIGIKMNLFKSKFGVQFDRDANVTPLPHP